VCRPLSPHCPLLALIITQIQGQFDFPAWLGKHGAKHTGERARKVIEGLKEQGITVFGGTGYCYGGTTQTSIRDCAAMLSPFMFQLARLVFDLAFDNAIHVAVIAHPSLLKPEDLDVRHSFVDILISLLSTILWQTYIAKSKAPLLINSCEEDDAFPKAFAETADQKFASFAPGYRRTYYEGAAHGFAVRGDIVREHVFPLHCPELEVHSAPHVQSKPKVKAAKEGAFKESVEWLIKYL
jgi:dienelactone hydrolase